LTTAETICLTITVNWLAFVAVIFYAVRRFKKVHVHKDIEVEGGAEK
jgi:hypothetical protein